ncbi:hypothetical protein BJ997_003297 [Cryobacterium roopkundense]|uniref:Uncharacterized protein n=1 Tax=Cryobacterium roopkundense TaxID=1001240 RepID=A0A7W8ZYU2_9MICO|nr:hypothetical protein [Cryobacterium roopkundense]
MRSQSLRREGRRIQRPSERQGARGTVTVLVLQASTNICADDFENNIPLQAYSDDQCWCNELCRRVRKFVQTGTENDMKGTAHLGQLVAFTPPARTSRSHASYGTTTLGPDVLTTHGRQEMRGEVGVTRPRPLIGPKVGTPLRAPHSKRPESEHPSPPTTSHTRSPDRIRGARSRIPHSTARSVWSASGMRLTAVRLPSAPTRGDARTRPHKA